MKMKTNNLVLPQQRAARHPIQAVVALVSMVLARRHCLVFSWAGNDPSVTRSRYN